MTTFSIAIASYFVGSWVFDEEYTAEYQEFIIEDQLPVIA
jgi:hypothetical protein